ncbi:hypothetical protein FQN57_005734 [Myotisia sp. PD_48]|nr:hypothetical protein FQN57_005734 [Myotisia sp. PD_48]
MHNIQNFHFNHLTHMERIPLEILHLILLNINCDDAYSLFLTCKQLNQKLAVDFYKKCISDDMRGCNGPVSLLKAVQYQCVDAFERLLQCAVRSPQFSINSSNVRLCIWPKNPWERLVDENRAFPFVNILSAACIAGNESIVKLALKYGAHPSTIDKSGLSALHFASYTSSSKIISLLLNAGAVVSQRALRTRGPDGTADLDHLRELGYPLATRGECSPSFRLNALDFSLCRPDLHPSITLINAGVEPNAISLITAAINGHGVIVLHILETKPKNVLSWKLLGDAFAKTTHECVAQALLEDGANINHRNARYILSHTFPFAKVKLAIAHDAIHPRCLRIAVLFQNVDIVEHLIKNKKEHITTAMTIAALRISKNARITTALLKHNFITPFPATIISHAIRHQYDEKIIALIDNGVIFPISCLRTASRYACFPAIRHIFRHEYPKTTRSSGSDVAPDLLLAEMRLNSRFHIEFEALLKSVLEDDTTKARSLISSGVDFTFKYPSPHSKKMLILDWIQSVEMARVIVQFCPGSIKDIRDCYQCPLDFVNSFSGE